MSLTYQNLLTYRISLKPTPNSSLSRFQIPKPQSQNPYTTIKPFGFRINHTPLRALASDSTINKPHQRIHDNPNLDSFLSIAEFLSLAFSAAISIRLALNLAFSGSQEPVFAWLANKLSVWHFVSLLSAVVIGAVIRRRQWRIISVDLSNKASGQCEGGNLVERIQKLEEDLNSSGAYIRVLSRQLEKLGIRFRVTRKALKDPIAQAAVLAQKNSEANRALAAQEDILEMELGEIQKVLLAMQEQQQKQLELILAIAKSGKLLEDRRGPSQDQVKIETSNSVVEGVKQTRAAGPIQALAGQKETNNDRV